MLAAAAVAAWPFLFHFQLVFQVHGRFRRLGNDFDQFYYVYKPYLLANLAHGHIPLWMPQEASGFSFILDPFTQALYPLNLVILPVAWLRNHWGPLDHQRYTVLAVSILALGLFLSLRKIGLGVLASMLAAILAASSYKVSETMRFPNATHAAAWMSIAIFAIIALRVTRSARKTVAFGALLGFSVVCIATAGYPYYLFYFFLTLIPFLVWLEYGTPTAFQTAKSSFLRFAVAIMIPIVGALLIVSPYLIGMDRLLSQTTDRGGGDWTYSTWHRFDGWSYVSSVLLPPLASPEGWFFFGTAGVALILTALVVVQAREGLGGQLTRIGALAVWIGSIIFFGLAGTNPLFRLVWETVPFMDGLRMWERINIVLVFPLAVTLGYAIQVLIRTYRSRAVSFREERNLLCIAGGALVLVLVLQSILAWTRRVHSEFAAYMGSYYGAPGKAEHIVASALALGAVLAGLLTLSLVRKSAHRRRVVMVATGSLFVAVWVAQIHGLRARPWMWVDPVVATTNTHWADLPIRRYSEVASLAARGAKSLRLGPGKTPTFDAQPPWTTAVYENWNFERYAAFLADGDIAKPLKNRLLGTTIPSRFFLTTNAMRGSPGRVRSASDADVRLIAYDGSRLVADVKSRSAADLIFADNWDRDWSAVVNGQRVKVTRVFGTFKAVAIPRGASRVEMAYCPFDHPPYRWLC